MSFNKNTWSKDYTGARGLKLLAALDAQKKGFSPKHSRVLTVEFLPKGQTARQTSLEKGGA